jgi:hypothetical protein
MSDSQSRYSQGAGESSSVHEDDQSVGQNDQDETESLDLDNIKNASDEGESDLYTTDGCKQTLAKVRWFPFLLINSSTTDTS